MKRTNWEKLKIEFFLSDHITVRSFLHDKTLTKNSHTRTMTKGWTKEKKQYLQMEGEEIKKMVIKKKGSLAADAVGSIMYQIKHNLLMHGHELSYRELRLGWEMCRMELGLPIRITEAAGVAQRKRTYHSSSRKMYEELMGE